MHYNSPLESTLNSWIPKPKGLTIAVAVSGGADSLALVFLLQEWALKKGVQIMALHVDHQLRPESTQEAQQVKIWLDSKNISCEILTWNHPPIASKLQETARDARHKLLTKKCHDLNIQHLFLAHHLDDQIETFMMRALKGSGLKGLSAIAPQTKLNGVCLLRPLLTMPKKFLVQYLAGHPHISDPSNQNEQFERSRIRKFLAEGKKLGISFDNISQTLSRIALGEDALDIITNSLFQTHVTCHSQGYLSISQKAFQDHPTEVVHRVIQKVLNILSPAPHVPRFQTLDTISTFIADPKSFQISAGKTLWQLKKGEILISKEPIYVTSPSILKSFQEFLWDGRFLIDNIMEKAIYSKIQVGMVGDHGLRMLRSHGINFEGFHTIYKTAPGLWSQEQLLSAPLLGFNTGLGNEFLRMRFLPQVPLNC